MYNPQLSPDGNQILAWKYPVSRRPQITTLSLSTKQFSNHSLNFIEPDWVTLADTIALETRETTGSVTFTPTGRLMRVNVQNSSIFELEPANVTTFSVEPLRS